MVGYLGYDHSMSVGDGVDERIKVVSRKVGVLRLDEDDRGGVVPREVDVERERVVKVREGDTILCPEGLADDNLVDVIKLVPILVPVVIKLTSELMYSCHKAPPLSNKAPPLATYNVPNELLVFDEWFKFWSSGNGNVESFCREERLQIKKVKIVVINKIGEELVAKAIESRHNTQSEVPSTIGGAIDKTGEREREKERGRGKEREKEGEREGGE